MNQILHNISKKLFCVVLTGYVFLASNIAMGEKVHGEDSCYACHTLSFSTSATKQTNSSNQPTSGNEVSLQTSQCLKCHDGSFKGAPDVFDSDGRSMLPGGDFLYSSREVRNGHNLGGQYGVDTRATSPGGNFPAHNLTCISCHSPHGSSQKETFEFRLLRKFVNGKDVSQSIQSKESDKQKLIENGFNAAITFNNHNVYRGNFSEWCASCHDKFFSQKQKHPTDGWRYHPSNFPLGNSAKEYGTTYDPEIPIEIAGLGSGNVVTPQDKVFCLTCHYAHAGPYQDTLRWDYSKTSSKQEGCRRCHF